MGSLVLADKQWATGSVITLSAIILIIQFLLSLWGVFAKWDDKLSKAMSLQIQELRIFNESQKLHAFRNTLSPEELRKKMSECWDLENSLAQDEHSQEISHPEKVFGYRSALHHLQISCPSCKKVPLSAPQQMNGECRVCSYFRLHF